MRTVCFILMLVATLRLAAQTAPELLPHASKETVISTYGWPRGRSVSGEREVWHYDAFDITLDHGRVEQIVPVPGAKSSQKKLGITTSVPPIAPVRSATSGPVPSATSRPAPSVRPSQQPTSLLPQPTIAVRASPPPTALEPFDPFEWIRRAMVYAAAMACLGVIGVALVLGLSRRRASKVAPTPPAPTTPPSVADAIAATLDRFHGREGSSAVPTPPILGSVGSLTMDRLQALEWKRFELIVARSFEARGLRCQRSRVGADGGIDAYLYRAAETRPFAFVQCKAWNSYRVGVKPVRELFGVMAAEQISEGYFVTTGPFTDEARRWAVGKLLHLIDGPEFLRQFNSLPADVRARIENEAFAGDYRTPTCPRCDQKLVARVSSQDQSKFWGCRNYPRCDYTLKVAAEN
jgi:hypothetical protein